MLLYYYHISGMEYSSNDNNIVYGNYFWENMSSKKGIYPDRPKWAWLTGPTLYRVKENYASDQN